jgi:diguanylate cyclase (GGDEF)-like protein
MAGGVVQECVREFDTASQQGGDEFVILLPEIAHQRDAAVIAAKIPKVSGAPRSLDLRELRWTASLGIATYPHDGEFAASLLKYADIAMYRAKDSGRNNYRFFQVQMNERVD